MGLQGMKVLMCIYRIYVPIGHTHVYIRLPSLPSSVLPSLSVSIALGLGVNAG